MSPWGLRASEGIIPGAVASLTPSGGHRSSGPCWPRGGTLVWEHLARSGRAQRAREASGKQSGTGDGL